MIIYMFLFTINVCVYWKKNISRKLRGFLKIELNNPIVVPGCNSFVNCKIGNNGYLTITKKTLMRFSKNNL